MNDSRTVWCVEVKNDEALLDRRIFSNNNKARKWIEYYKRQPGAWTDETVVNCFDLQLDSWHWTPSDS